jgi:hypothetical protein
MAGEFIARERSSHEDTGTLTTDCRYLGGMVPMVPEGSGCRISGFGETYCILMNRLPCPENCPDRKTKR